MRYNLSHIVNCDQSNLFAVKKKKKTLTMHLSHIANHGHFPLLILLWLKKHFDNTFKPCHKSR